MKTDLNNLNNSNPFKVPEGYFSDLESNILSKTVGKTEEKNPFKTPDTYFSDLETSILSKTVEKKEEKKGKIITLFTKKSYWISAAACLFFAILLGIYTLRPDTNQTTLTVADTEKAISLIDELYISAEEETLAVSEINNTVSDSSRNLYASSNTSTTPKVSDKPQNQESLPAQNQSETIEKISEVLYSLYFEEEDWETEDDFLYNPI